MTTATRRPFRPSHGIAPHVGPFGVAVRDEVTGQWKRALTADGWARLNEFLADRPDGGWLVGLLVRYYPTTYSAARNAGMDNEDIRQWCYIGCVRAMQTYDPKGGASFHTYCSFLMRAALSHETKRLRTFGSFSLNTPVGDKGDGDLFDLLARDDEVDHDLPAKKRAVHDAVRKASPCERSRRMFTLRHGLDGEGQRSYRDVAVMCGVSHQRVQQIVSVMEEKMRNILIMAGVQS